MRELTLGRVVHPDPLRVGDSGRVLHLVDDDLTKRIQAGDGTLGWEGDERLALYIDPQARTWELWRLEADMVYRCSIRLAADVFSGADVVPQMITRFMAHDSRRGFNPAEDVMAHNRGLDAQNDKAWAELNEEFAHRLRHGLHKDGVW